MGRSSLARTGLYFQTSYLGQLEVKQIFTTHHQGTRLKVIYRDRWWYCVPRIWKDVKYIVGWRFRKVRRSRRGTCKKRRFILHFSTYLEEQLGRFLKIMFDIVLFTVFLFVAFYQSLEILIFLKASLAGFYSSRNTYPPPMFWIFTISCLLFKRLIVRGSGGHTFHKLQNLPVDAFREVQNLQDLINKTASGNTAKKQVKYNFNILFCCFVLILHHWRHVLKVFKRYKSVNCLQIWN